jgi:hypothetical protein
MEFRQTITADRSSNFNGFADAQTENELVRQRLDFFLAANAETERQKAMFRGDREKLEAEHDENAVDDGKNFCLFRSFARHVSARRALS